MSVILLKILIIVVMLANVGAMLFTMLLMTSGRYSFWLLLLALILEFAAQFWLRGVYDRLPAWWG